ncbi:hypothetical protein [Flavobacterium franklandianum]|uniref:Uncharacterized protein n=1 Tax=Flavobacterium franklandianum TaxID=2594430 RepID=A0A553CNX7_9FLAO|nr:hypothetical protein [Flavobacterium franklandianum]TRX22094.1 hypothetical protein FNW17_05330 [Flavobacterium franklandianum]
MSVILTFLPFFFIPYLMAHLFKGDYSHRGLTYVFTIIAALIYSILFDWINSYFQAESNKIKCHFPLVIFPIFFSPIIIFLQYYFNKIILWDDNEID